jgi:hypothetical protein
MPATNRNFFNKENSAIIPLFGIKIENTLEDDPKEGKTAWIDLLEIEDLDHTNYLVDVVTGKADVFCTEGWNSAGTFDIIETCGLPPRFVAKWRIIIEEVDGPERFLEAITEIGLALQILQVNLEEDTKLVLRICD